jgi:endoribonuclease Dicer
MGKMRKREVRMQHVLPIRVSWHQMNESLHSNIFTPREYQVELVSCALSRNIIVCLGSATAKFFIATSVIRDLAYQVR